MSRPNLCCIGLVAPLAAASALGGCTSECDGDVSVYDYTSPNTCEVIGGNLLIEGEVAFPALRSVEGDVTFVPRLVKKVEFPKLQTVRGSLVIGQVYSTSTVRLPALERVGGQLILADLPEVQTLELGPISKVGALRLIRVVLPGTIAFPNLRTVDDHVEVTETTFTEVRLPALDTTGALAFQANPDLTHFAASVESLSSFLTVNSNPVLTSFALDDLTLVDGPVDIEVNPALSSCAVEAFLSGIEISGAQVVQENLDDTPCL